MSPASRSASATSRMTRARPSMAPAETGKPTRAPAGKTSRRYAPAMASPSDVSTRGGVSALYDLTASSRWGRRRCTRRCARRSAVRAGPGRRERFVRPDRVLALADEPVIHLVRAHDVLELLEREVEDVLLLTKHVGPHEAPGFFPQGLLGRKVAAGPAGLGGFPGAE